MTNKLPQRSEIPQKDRWDLELIYKDVDAWEQDFEDAAREMKDIPSFQGRLTESGETLFRFMELTEAG